MGKSKFLKGVIVGAAVGGLLSLLDKNTRQEVGASIKNSGDCITKYSKDPQLLIDSSKEIYQKLRTTADQVSQDIHFINEKVDEIKGMAPQVKEMIEDTKDTFQHSTEVYKEALHEEEEQEELDSFKGY
jgi:gas vesicle protein